MLDIIAFGDELAPDAPPHILEFVAIFLSSMHSDQMI